MISQPFPGDEPCGLQWTRGLHDTEPPLTVGNDSVGGGESQVDAPAIITAVRHFEITSDHLERRPGDCISLRHAEPVLCLRPAPRTLWIGATSQVALYIWHGVTLC